MNRTTNRNCYLSLSPDTAYKYHRTVWEHPKQRSCVNTHISYRYINACCLFCLPTFTTISYARLFTLYLALFAFHLTWFSQARSGIYHRRIRCRPRVCVVDRMDWTLCDVLHSRNCIDCGCCVYWVQYISVYVDDYFFGRQIPIFSLFFPLFWFILSLNESLFLDLCSTQKNVRIHIHILYSHRHAYMTQTLRAADCFVYGEHQTCIKQQRILLFSNLFYGDFNHFSLFFLTSHG